MKNQISIKTKKISLMKSIDVRSSKLILSNSNQDVYTDMIDDNIKEKRKKLVSLKDFSVNLKLVLEGLKSKISEPELTIEEANQLIGKDYKFNRFDEIFEYIETNRVVDLEYFQVVSIAKDIKDCSRYIRHQIHLIRKKILSGLQNIFQNKELAFIIARRYNSYCSGDEENKYNTELKLVALKNANHSIYILNYLSQNEQKSKRTIHRLITRFYQ